MRKLISVLSIVITLGLASVPTLYDRIQSYNEIKIYLVNNPSVNPNFYRMSFYNEFLSPLSILFIPILIFVLLTYFSLSVKRQILKTIVVAITVTLSLALASLSVLGSSVMQIDSPSNQNGFNLHFYPLFFLALAPLSLLTMTPIFKKKHYQFFLVLLAVTAVLLARAYIACTLDALIYC